MRTSAPIERLVDVLEGASRLDPPARGLSPLANALAGDRQGAVLRGEWLGHALHPLLTDFPLGCWIAAGLLDLGGSRSGRRAAQRLVGLGLVFVPVTAAAGLVDWAEVRDDDRVRRLGVAHALGNTVVAGAYLMSWRARRRGHHARGVVWALGGGGLAWVTGYLGGHLSFGRGVGVGQRGERTPRAIEAGTTPDPAAQEPTGDAIRDVHQAS